MSERTGRPCSSAPGELSVSGSEELVSPTAAEQLYLLCLLSCPVLQPRTHFTGPPRPRQHASLSCLLTCWTPITLSPLSGSQPPEHTPRAPRGLAPLTSGHSSPSLSPSASLLGLPRAFEVGLSLSSCHHPSRHLLALSLDSAICCSSPELGFHAPHHASHHDGRALPHRPAVSVRQGACWFPKPLAPVRGQPLVRCWPRCGLGNSGLDAKSHKHP